MTTKYPYKYSYRISAFFLALLLAFSIPAAAHDSLSSHSVFKGMGDGYRALMSKDGYGRSFFTLYVNLDVTITNESGKSTTENLVEKLGTAFYTNGVLLTNSHVTDVTKRKKEYIEKTHALYSALSPPQTVSLRFNKSYKAVDSNGVTFLVSLPVRSDTIDAALFRFQTEPASPPKSFILQDESEVSFSPIAALGSPFDISNMLVTGNIARDKLYHCVNDKTQEYLLFMSSINPGNSGGPLYNLETDKVNGMVTAALEENGNNSMISCAVPASALIKFLNENLPPRKK
jgi:S1-C subfamily serine protease